MILGAGWFDPLRVTLVLGVRGGLTIPAELRHALAIEGGGELVAEATPQGLLLRPVYTFAVDEPASAQALLAAPSGRSAKRRIH